MEDAAHKPRQCSRCGKPLPIDAAEGLCAACLLSIGAESITQSAGDAPTAWGGEASDTASGPSRLIAGQLWGPYRVGRLLGRGGMGEVYEAEHIRSGRRLALKVLRSRLQSADERARFLLEGQLAASVSHPHTVYIFGSEEISGTPVISMELTPGGTLKDRVASKGPLPPTEAVSAVLDIIGGLDAAHSVGILHRDIKPSNCFVDSQGNVKVGDFGLSISTLARDVRDDVSGRGFQGTPQFASPEQLRGEALDVRSDIYAVGATLYYLLTGEPPFEAENLRDLVQKVTTQTPKSPRLLRPGIHSGLAGVVLKCLAKTPAERPGSYADLVRDLKPFSSTGQTPAGLGVRWLAGFVDNALFNIALTPPMMVGALGAVGPFVESTLWSLVGMFIYFLLEGFFGATPGKWVFGLRVRALDGGIAPWGRIVWRNFLYYLPILAWAAPIPILGIARYNALMADPVRMLALASPFWVVMAAYFVTARRRNGWAAIHDLASRTRVVRRSGVERPHLVMPAGSPPLPGEQVAPGLHYGPFAVISDAGAADEGRLYVAFDPALRRRVWIQTHSTGTLMISAGRRDVSRVGRLRWLTGKRSDEENWDAFEAPDGDALSAHPNRTGRTSWPTMKLWLTDLANELHAAIQEGTLPNLALDRIWIRSDGRLVLLDFPATGLSSKPALESVPGNLTPVQLLYAVASFSSYALASPNSLPLRVRSMMEQWAAPAPPDLAEARAGLLDLLTVPDQVTWWRRGLIVGMTALPFLTIAPIILIRAVGDGFMPPDKFEMIDLLASLDEEDRRSDPPAYIAAREVYLAGRHGAALRDDTFWDSQLELFTGELRKRAADVASRHPSVSAADLAQAEIVIAPELEKIRRRQDSALFYPQVASVMGIMISVVIAIWSLIWSVFLPGGLLLRASGLAAVNRHGRRIGRLRSAVRVLVTWSPAIVVGIGQHFYFEITGDNLFQIVPWWLAVGTLLPLILGALGTVTHPERGLQDRLTGTWIVPR